MIGVAFNVVACGKHIPKIEQFHEIIIERCRYYYTMLPFTSLPRIIAVHLMMTVIFYINAFAWLKRVSQYLFLLSIVEGMVLDFDLHFKVIFGSINTSG